MKLKYIYIYIYIYIYQACPKDAIGREQQFILVEMSKPWK